MNDSKISVRYAKALFELALESASLPAVEADMRLILELSLTPDFRVLIDNPVIPPSRKLGVFTAAFGGKLHNLTMALAAQVIRNSREQFLPAIARNFIDMSVREQGITEVTLTTAVRASEEVKKSITELVARTFNTIVSLEEVVDGDLIGGFILRVDDNLIDASVRNRLRKIEKAMTEN
jgi:F-type H+-transporting ATPase subunit delta